MGGKRESVKSTCTCRCSMFSFARTLQHGLMHLSQHVHMYTCMQAAHMHARMQGHTQAHTHACAHTRTHARTHACTHAQGNTIIHVHTPHTLACSILSAVGPKEVRDLAPLVMSKFGRHLV